MRDLLKTDFKRVLKDKLFLILCIVVGVFALSSPLLYKALFALVPPEEMAEVETMLAMQINAKMLFFNAFSLTNNFGLLLPVLITIVLCKDFSHGTIRNKIISGKPRTSVFFSLLITCSVFVCGIMLAQALLTLAVSLLFFDYQPTAFTASDFGYFMASIGFKLLICLLVSALLTFFIVTMKNAGLAIVMYFVVNFGCVIIGVVTQTVFPFLDAGTAAHGILQFLNRANAFATMIVGNGTSYSLGEVLSLLLPNLVITAALILFGWMIFRKKDLK